VERVTGNSDEMWKKLGHESLLNTYEEYKDFLRGREQATFIRFTNLKELPKVIPAKTISDIVGVDKMPQMGVYISQETANRLLRAGGVKT